MKKYDSIDEYIEKLNFPVSTRAILQKIREIIKKTAPQAQEAISYGIPTFKLNGNLVHFAGYKKHIGFYPGSHAIEVFKSDLKKFEISKGTVRFPLDKPIPYNLIEKIVRFRVSQNIKQVQK